jgi:hypothetical protein
MDEMSGVRQILAQVNKIAGVRGSLVIAPGGLVVESDLAGDEDPSALGALASSVSATLEGALRKLDFGSLHRYILSGPDGSAVLWSLGDSALVLVLLRKDVNIGMVLVELKDAARQLSEAIQL